MLQVRFNEAQQELESPLCAAHWLLGKRTERLRGVEPAGDAGEATDTAYHRVPDRWQQQIGDDRAFADEIRVTFRSVR